MISGAPWVEKYRPKLIDEISHQETVKSVLKEIRDTHKMPHLLFHGPPGTGKTTAILALCHEMYGPDFKVRVKELNASDDRGIKIVQGPVKDFAQLLPGNLENSQAAAFKILILDEADMMTRDAQTCMRRIMEDHCANTRFVLICNYVSNIIPPIISRCASFRFEPVAFQAQKERLMYVCKNEGISIDNDAMDLLLETSAGDMRCVLNVLQASSTYGHLTAAKMNDALGIPPDSISSDFIMTAMAMTSESGIQEWVDETHSAGWDVLRLIKKMCKSIAHGQLSNVKKAILVQRLAEIQVATTEGGNEYISLLNIGLEIFNLRDV